MEVRRSLGGGRSDNGVRTLGGELMNRELPPGMRRPITRMVGTIIAWSLVIGFGTISVLGMVVVVRWLWGLL